MCKVTVHALYLFGRPTDRLIMRLAGSFSWWLVESGDGRPTRHDPSPHRIRAKDGPSLKSLNVTHLEAVSNPVLYLSRVNKSSRRLLREPEVKWKREATEIDPTQPAPRPMSGTNT